MIPVANGIRYRKNGNRLNIRHLKNILQIIKLVNSYIKKHLFKVDIFVFNFVKHFNPIRFVVTSHFSYSNFE